MNNNTESWPSGLWHRFTKPTRRNPPGVRIPQIPFTVNYSSGQRGQTVNLMAMPSLVRLQHSPFMFPDVDPYFDNESDIYEELPVTDEYPYEKYRFKNF